MLCVFTLHRHVCAVKRNFHVKRFPLFADAVTRAMDARKLTGRDLAAKLGVREQTVSGWRKGKFRPNTEDLKKLAAELHVSLETLRSDDRPLSTQRAPKSIDYWRGVRYAAEAMTETTLRLLREEREAYELAAMDAAREAPMPNELPDAGRERLPDAQEG